VPGVFLGDCPGGGDFRAGAGFVLLSEFVKSSTKDKEVTTVFGGDVLPGVSFIDLAAGRLLSGAFLGVSFFDFDVKTLVN